MDARHPALDATPGSGQGVRMEIRWQVARDESFFLVVAEGTVRTGPERDHTVKIDVGGLVSYTRTHAEVFPAIAYQRVAARGLLLIEKDVVRVIDGVLLPAMRASASATGLRPRGLRPRGLRVPATDQRPNQTRAS